MVDLVERFFEKKFGNDPALRKQISALYQTYKTWEIKDSKFDKDFCDGRNDHFYPYLWEMLLAHHLKNLGFALSSKDEGPDFKIEYQGQTLWIEATCPSPKRTLQRHHDDPLFAYAAALKAKNEKLITHTTQNGRQKPGYLAKDIVKPHDPYVIALNTSRLELCDNSHPFKHFVLQATLGSTSFHPAPKHPKLYHVESMASHGLFHDPHYKNVSAVLATSQGIQTLRGVKPEVIVIHNPYCENKLPLNLLGVDEEYSIGIEKVF
jgi:hypothetical protein